ncbi:MAG: 4'-phosphopantetheinyl transferase superfamily protein [Frankia sp.]|nr:4'-phosphopantetheinyl transferase superfamily protein [Frankia sp.]
MPVPSASSALIDAVLPPTVAAVEMFGDDPHAVLFPAEEATLGRAVAKRRNEFTSGRVCARRALGRLGIGPVAVLPGPKREPLWPEGVVGSITHCAGYRAAAVGWAREVVTIGIDAEPNGPTPPGVLESVTLPAERAWVTEALRADQAVHWDRLLFSAKESVYKAWYPLARRWLGFEDAELTITPGEAGTGEFVARLLVPGPVLPSGEQLTTLRGRFLARPDLIVTAVALPR